MNNDWNPTDEDTWLSNAARELFGFPVVQKWVINPDYISVDIEQDIPSIYKSVYFDGTGITDKGKS